MPDDINKISAAEIAARQNIRKSALDALTPYDDRGDLGAYGLAHSPCGAIPTDYGTHQVSRSNVPGDGSGWQHEIPISNPPGTAQCDKLMDAADARDRQAAQAQHGSDVTAQAMETMATMLRQQGKLLNLVVEGEKVVGDESDEMRARRRAQEAKEYASRPRPNANWTGPGN